MSSQLVTTIQRWISAGMGGKARAKKLSAERRKEISHHAITTRWDRYRAKKAVETEEEKTARHERRLARRRELKRLRRAIVLEERLRQASASGDPRGAAA